MRKLLSLLCILVLYLYLHSCQDIKCRTPNLGELENPISISYAHNKLAIVSSPEDVLEWCSSYLTIYNVGWDEKTSAVVISPSKIVPLSGKVAGDVTYLEKISSFIVGVRDKKLLEIVNIKNELSLGKISVELNDISAIDTYENVINILSSFEKRISIIKYNEKYDFERYKNIGIKTNEKKPKHILSSKDEEQYTFNLNNIKGKPYLSEQYVRFATSTANNTVISSFIFAECLRQEEDCSSNIDNYFYSSITKDYKANDIFIDERYAAVLTEGGLEVFTQEKIIHKNNMIKSGILYMKDDFLFVLNSNNLYAVRLDKI